MGEAGKQAGHGKVHKKDDTGESNDPAHHNECKLAENGDNRDGLHASRVAEERQAAEPRSKVKVVVVVALTVSAVSHEKRFAVCSHPDECERRFRRRGSRPLRQ